jgi:predicted component of type VI protein secretion system
MHGVSAQSVGHLLLAQHQNFKRRSSPDKTQLQNKSATTCEQYFSLKVN